MQNINTVAFIHEVKIRPTIWCSTNPHYKNKYVLRKKWEEISTLFPGIQVADLRKKWKNIRDNYRKELKKCLISRSADEEETYGSSWKYFDIMSFAKDELTPVPCELNVKQEQDSDDNNSASAGEECTETQVECKAEPGLTVEAKKRTTAQDLREEYLEIEKKKFRLLQNESRQKLDDFPKSQDYHFLMSLLPEIEKLPVVNKLRLRNRFNDILMEEINSVFISGDY